MKKRSNTFRVAISYLAVIMVMSIIFSGLIFWLTSSQLGHPLGGDKDGGPHDQPSASIQLQLHERDEQTRNQIIFALVSLNLGVLVVGSFLSYFLARRTLIPIENAMEVQSRFVSDASHELRTPLTVLQTSNEVALRKKQLSEEKARTVLQNNIIEIEKLRELSNALLELTQVERKTRATESVRINDLVNEVVEGLKPVAAKKHLALQTDIKELKIDVNSQALKQILLIFMDNAIKYSPESSSVTIGASTDNKAMTIYVKDKGEGIAADSIDRIFDRFYRAESARTRTGSSGYGLGLAIAKSISDHQGYTLGVSSKLGVGSTFFVKIPC